MRYEPEHWTRRAWQGLLLLLVIAIGARVVFRLLVPLVPALVALVVLGGICLVVFRGRWR